MSRRRGRYNSGKREIENRTFDEFRAMVRERAEKGEAECWGAASMRTGDRAEEFTGTKSLEDALQLADRGWPEGTAQIMAGIDASEAGAITSLIPALHYDVAGEFPDVGAYCAGEPEHMVWQDQDASSARPVVKIAFSGGMAYHMTPEQATNYGVVALSYIDALLQSGRSVELHWVGNWEGERGGRYVLDVTIMEAGTVLDTDRLAFLLVHRSMARRLSFAAKEMLPKWKELRSDYGVAQEPPADLLPGFIRFPAINAMKGRGDLESRETALYALRKFIQNEGDPTKQQAA